MSTEPESSATSVDEAPTANPPRQRWRVGMAAVEVVAGVLLVVAARWAWQQGMVSIQLPGPDGATDVVTRIVGSWPAVAVVAATVAGLLVIDAVRHLTLAPGRR